MIELINVSKYYPTEFGRHYVFRDVSLRLPLDKSVGVIGPNGAGKSTFLRLLGGSDIPSQGSIIRTGRISPPMGLTPGLQNSLTAAENARFAGRIYGMDRDEIADLIDYVRETANIGKFFDMPISVYSAGMKQRVSFAINMSMTFDYYLFDEIGAGGDREFRKTARAMVEERLKTSKFIIASHRTDELLDLCDSGIVIKDGTFSFFEDIRDALAVYITEDDDEGDSKSRRKRRGKKSADGEGDAADQSAKTERKAQREAKREARKDPATDATNTSDSAGTTIIAGPNEAAAAATGVVEDNNRKDKRRKRRAPKPGFEATQTANTSMPGVAVADSVPVQTDAVAEPPPPAAEDPDAKLARRRIKKAAKLAAAQVQEIDSSAAADSATRQPTSGEASIIEAVEVASPDIATPSAMPDLLDTQVAAGDAPGEDAEPDSQEGRDSRRARILRRRSKFEAPPSAAEAPPAAVDADSNPAAEVEQAAVVTEAPAADAEPAATAAEDGETVLSRAELKARRANRREKRLKTKDGGQAQALPEQADNNSPTPEQQHGAPSTGGTVIATDLSWHTPVNPDGDRRMNALKPPSDS